MNVFEKEALDKLETGCRSGKFGAKAGAMKEAVKTALADFCRQNAEFAQAVAQGGSFTACMEAVAEGVGQSLSDLEAYTRAVRFYFPGALIRVQMSIDLVGEASPSVTALAGDRAATAPSEREPGNRRDEKKDGILLDFTDFL